MHPGGWDHPGYTMQIVTGAFEAIEETSSCGYEFLSNMRIRIEIQYMLAL
jgi:hypothetical protein